MMEVSHRPKRLFQRGSAKRNIGFLILDYARIGRALSQCSGRVRSRRNYGAVDMINVQHIMDSIAGTARGASRMTRRRSVG